MKKTLLLASALIVSSQTISAAESAKAPEWKASAELGYVSTTGNTETDTLNAKASATTEREKWRHKLELTALNTSDGGGTTAEKYTVMGQSDYLLKAPNYLFANINYEKDRFSGFEYQTSENVGYGRRVVDEADMKLDLEIGPGARQTKEDNASSESEATIRAALKLEWDISKTSKFNEVLTIDSGEDITITKSVTSLASQIEGNLSMKITYTYKETSEVADGFDDTDTETAVTLVYTF